MKKKVGLYFGSFNPITKAHEKIALYVINHTSIEEVQFVISPQNPHKEQKDLLNVETRIELINEICKDYQNMQINTIELNLPIPSYTIDTLNEIEKKNDNNEYHIIMGYDVFETIHTWKNYKDVLNYPIILLPRKNNDNYDKFLEYKKELERSINQNINITYLQEMNIMHISSTEVRNNIKENKNINNLVNPKVLKIIQEKKLYL